jgi:acyl-coenzyme A thioesterase PaaI-like protein
MSTSPSWTPETGHYEGCYVCAPHGLGARVWVDGEIARAEIALDSRHAGSPNHAHGGVIAMLLDEVLGTVAMIHGIAAVTGTLEIKYRSPAFLGETYQLSARLLGSEGRRLQIVGDMTGPQGLVAEATGTWVRVDMKHFAPGPHA